MTTEANERKKIQQAYSEYVFLKQLFDAFNRNIALLSNLLAETRTAIEVIEEIKKIDKSKILVVPLSSSVFLKVLFEPKNKVFVDVGSNIIIEKGYDEAIRYLQERENRLKIELEQANRNLSQLSERIKQLEIILQNLVRQVEK